MISESTKQYCSEDISLIENYDEAIADKTQIWDCHHRLELQGQFHNSASLLQRCGLYFNVPASQLIFLRHADHIGMHARNRSETSLNKMSEAKKGNSNKKGVKLSQTACEKLREIGRQLHWYTNGKISTRAETCPAGFTKGLHFSESTLDKIHKQRAGRKLSPELKRKISERTKLAMQRIKKQKSGC